MELSENDVRTELARVAKTNMPMSPFMAGAYDMVKALAPSVAAVLDKQHLSPVALQPLNPLNLIDNVGRILEGNSGSLRDRFATCTGGDLSAKTSTAQIYLAA